MIMDVTMSPLLGLSRVSKVQRNAGEKKDGLDTVNLDSQQGAQGGEADQ